MPTKSPKAQPSADLKQDSWDKVRLGDEIRKLRKARGYSLVEVASAIHRSISFISQLERGHASPSVVDLKGIAQVLDVPLGWFFSHDQVPSTERGIIVRNGERRRLGLVTNGLVEELLSPDIGGAFELFLSTFAPGTELKEFQQRDTEEEGYVVKGSLVLWVEKKQFTLHTGDSFRIVRKPFRWANRSKEETVVVWVISPPTY